MICALTRAELLGDTARQFRIVIIGQVEGKPEVRILAS